MKISAGTILRPLALLLLTASGLISPVVLANKLTVAVAGNFDVTAEELKRDFEARTDHTVTIVMGTTSDLYARIMEGAPFDIFLSTDTTRPEVLEEQGKIVPGSRFTYAFGKLVLWSVDNRHLGEQVLLDKSYRLLAITDPRLASYGRAARELLEALKLWDDIQDRIVMGENIGQTYHFAISGDVDMALIPFSQIIYGDYMQAGSYWLVPDSLYSPIEQQGVLLTDNPTARQFLAFMQSAPGRQIILSNGYDAP